MTRFILLLAGALMLPGIASGADWLKGCQAGLVTKQLQPGMFACVNPTSNTDNSDMLSVSGCENIDLLWFEDIAQVGDDNATAITYCCGVPTDNDGDDPTGSPAAWDGNTGICWPIENHTFSAVVGQEAVYGAACEWIYTDPVVLTDDTPRQIVRCNGPSN